MSTPMFIRSPLAATAHPTSNAVAVTALVPAVAEATLIEEVLCVGGIYDPAGVVTNSGDTLAGHVVLFLTGLSGDPKPVFIGAMPASSGAARIFFRAPVNIVIPVGWALSVWHNVQTSGPSDGPIQITVTGGVIR